MIYIYIPFISECAQSDAVYAQAQVHARRWPDIESRSTGQSGCRKILQQQTTSMSHYTTRRNPRYAHLDRMRESAVAADMRVQIHLHSATFAPVVRVLAHTQEPNWRCNPNPKP